MKWLGSTESKITKDNNGENVPYPEITEVVLVHCSIFYKDCQQDLRVLCTFVSKKQFLPTNSIFLKTFNSECLYLWQIKIVKACVRNFSSNFYFSIKWQLFKNWKIFFISSKTLFLFSRYSDFCIFSSSFPLFPDSKGQAEVE